MSTRARQQRCLAECKVCPLQPSPGSTSTATCSSRWPILATSLWYHLVIPVFFPRYLISLSKVSYSPRVHSVAHMLLVTEAQGGDAGQYRCTARNEVPDLYFWLFFIIAVFESMYWQESFWGDIRDNWQKYKISRSRWASCLWLFIFKWSRLLSLVSCSTSASEPSHLVVVQYHMIGQSREFIENHLIKSNKEIMLFCQIVCFRFMMPTCPLWLSWCQIVRWQIVLAFIKNAMSQKRKFSEYTFFDWPKHVRSLCVATLANMIYRHLPTRSPSQCAWGTHRSIYYNSIWQQTVQYTTLVHC